MQTEIRVGWSTFSFLLWYRIEYREISPVSLLNFWYGDLLAKLSSITSDESTSLQSGWSRSAEFDCYTLKKLVPKNVWFVSHEYLLFVIENHFDLKQSVQSLKHGWDLIHSNTPNQITTFSQHYIQQAVFQLFRFSLCWKSKVTRSHSLKRIYPGWSGRLKAV